jgi:plasmid stabilization system protein ParE
MKKVLWSEFASDNLRLIFDYHKRKATITVAKSIKKKIFIATNLLCTQPDIVQVELWLEHLGEGHRYLNVGNYKIIYKAIEDIVLITDLFDTRQDPKTMNEKNEMGCN